MEHKTHIKLKSAIHALLFKFEREYDVYGDSMDLVYKGNIEDTKYYVTPDFMLKEYRNKVTIRVSPYPLHS